MALQEELEKQGIWLFKNRSLIPLCILPVALFLYVNTKPTPSNNDFNVEYYNISCLVLSIIGLVIRVYTVGYTPKNTSGRNTTEGQVADILNISGAYSLVRHPLYVGNFLMWLGPALLTQKIWFVISFALLFWIYYERIMYAEEQFLRRKFKNDYLLWTEKVPAFFPQFKNFIKPTLTFSWKKVLKKEKNGLLAVFLIFSGFDIAGNIIKNENNYNYFFISGSLTTFILYIILKYLKKKTEILNETDR